jgi:hypothetical protein
MKRKSLAIVAKPEKKLNLFSRANKAAPFFPEKGEAANFLSWSR